MVVEYRTETEIGRPGTAYSCDLRCACRRRRLHKSSNEIRVIPDRRDNRDSAQVWSDLAPLRNGSIDGR